jgi:transposase-like protein
VRQGEWFKGRQFTAEVILWAVHWYLMFSISYRDLELMFADCGVDVDHTTIFRWIQAYAPEKRIRPHLRRSNGSWRVDETHVRRMEGSHVEGEACGFRPGRSQHDALNALAYGISLRQVRGC